MVGQGSKAAGKGGKAEKGVGKGNGDGPKKPGCSKCRWAGCKSCRVIDLAGEEEEEAEAETGSKAAGGGAKGKGKGKGKAAAKAGKGGKPSRSIEPAELSAILGVDITGMDPGELAQLIEVERAESAKQAKAAFPTPPQSWFDGGGLEELMAIMDGGEWKGSDGGKLRWAPAETRHTSSRA